MLFSGGLPETACGKGSTLAATVNLRAMLPGVLKSIGAKSLFDAPCGDFNWMSHTDLSGIEYVGCDSSAVNLETATSRASIPEEFAPRSLYLIYGNIGAVRFPESDVMFCRDFFQHITAAEVKIVLRLFERSSIPWLMATSHMNLLNREVSYVGGFRPLNLTADPYNFPPPRQSIQDGEARIIGLWSHDDVAIALSKK